MSLKPEQFARRVGSEDLPPVILLAGAEPLLVLEAADAVRARARAKGCNERVVLEADARFDWDELAREAVTQSLFSARRLLELRLPGGRAGRAGSRVLAEWCKAPPADVVLLITGDDWSRKHEVAWVKAVDQAGWFVPFWPIRPEAMPGWVQARLRAAGIDADASAAALLVDRTEGNLLAAAQEVEKLALLDIEGRLDARTLSGLVADSARYDVFALTDAAFAGDAPRALRIARGLRHEGSEPLAVLGWLGRQVETALRLAAAPDFAAQAREERLWEARQRLFRAALRRLRPEHWLACVAAAAGIDRIVKGRADGDAWLELERLVLIIAAPAAGMALGTSIADAA